jgi:hypothetical protein
MLPAGSDFALMAKSETNRIAKCLLSLDGGWCATVSVLLHGSERDPFERTIPNAASLPFCQ